MLRPAVPHVAPIMRWKPLLLNVCPCEQQRCYEQQATTTTTTPSTTHHCYVSIFGCAGCCGATSGVVLADRNRLRSCLSRLVVKRLGNRSSHRRWIASSQ